MLTAERGALPALSAGDHQRLADLLREAARERRRVEPLSVQHPDLTVADARRIRDRVIADRLADGERLAGAVASPGRAGEPQLAWVTDAMLMRSGLVGLNDLIDPHVEPRLALRLVSRLEDPLVTVGELVAVSRGLRLCLEVIDSRYVPGPLTPADVIADNCGTSKLLVAGETAAPGAEALADGAIHALVMLAAALARRHGGLEAGTLLVAPLHGAARWPDQLC
jgi:2-oxo-3-hexenedioate decarboxylase